MWEHSSHWPHFSGTLCFPKALATHYLISVNTVMNQTGQGVLALLFSEEPGTEKLRDFLMPHSFSGKGKALTLSLL